MCCPGRLRCNCACRFGVDFGKHKVSLQNLTAVIAQPSRRRDSVSHIPFGDLGDRYMLRAALAIVATIILVGVLGLLIVESRSVDETYFAEHAERMRAVEASRDDLSSIVNNAESIFAEGRAVPDVVQSAIARLATSNAVLQSQLPGAEAESDLAKSLIAYDASLASFIVDGKAFIEQQGSLAEALRVVQEESPEVVKALRRFDFRLQSQTAFSFALDLIEFASGQSGADPDQLAERLRALSEDQALNDRAPGLVDEFASAASTVIAQRQAADEALRELARNTASDRLWELSNAMLAENRVTVSRAERARLLLSVCTLVLLGGVGFVAYRLQASYRDLNRSNAQLAVVNDSLEERVKSRTAELSSAYNDLKESQVQLVQAEKMSSLGELVAGISHEINTPLWYLINNATIIQERLQTVDGFAATASEMIDDLRAGKDTKTTLKGGLNAMRKMLSDGLKDDVDEAADLIRDSIEGLEELTELAQSLKDFSRLDRSQKGQFNVNDGLEKTLLITRNKLKNKVEVHKHFGDVPAIYCSPSQINQIFLNLITNAADAIEDSGEIAVTTWAEDDMVRIKISDTGAGIPEDLLEKIRDPFFTTKEVGKGTGLGMSIVDRIIESHNGTLDIESEVGKGTSMTVSLPIASEAGQPGDLNDELDDAESVAEGSSANDAGDEVEQDEPEAATA